MCVRRHRENVELPARSGRVATIAAARCDGCRKSLVRSAAVGRPVEALHIHELVWTRLGMSEPQGVATVVGKRRSGGPREVWS